ncbi:uncharacterized protein VTP21DRAFT_1260 [Calcarisporiella thermophila]|uniref:uncharacterized protein n=1 Tax=Calcarisporiella thermophila TaxID=911321 RepID=UPI003743F703
MENSSVSTPPPAKVKQEEDDEPVKIKTESGDGTEEIRQNPSPSIDTPTASRRRVVPPPERPMTRGMSGAVPRKSVEEILSGHDPGFASTSSLRSPAGTPTSEKGIKTPSVRLTTKRSSDKFRTSMTGRRLHDSERRERSSRASHRYSRQQQANGEPVDLYEWLLRMQSKPLHKTLQSASKIVTTHDWTIARDELKSIRALQRIESLKNANMWSFRQLKRHKAPPRTKSSWDYLLDEMRWLQADFKEERKWKISLAYQLAHWVMEWHNAENKEEVCIKRHIPEAQPLLDSPMNIDGQTSTLLESETKSNDTPMVLEYAENEKVEDAEEVKAEAVSEDGALNRNIAEDIQGPSAGNAAVVEDKPPHPLDPADALVQQPASGAEIVASPVNATEQPAVPWSLSEEQDQDQSMTSRDTSVAPELLQQLSSALLELGPIDNIFCFTGLEDSGFDPQLVFPEMSLYQPPTPDDNDAYIDEIEQFRVVPLSQLMTKKPILKRKRPVYRSAADAETDSDTDFEEPVSPHATEITTAPSLFVPRKQKELPMPSVHPPPQPNSAQSQPSTWHPEDDAALLSLVSPMQHNWNLIADIYNSTRAAVSGERRTAYDCYERWVRLEHQNVISMQTQMALGPGSIGALGRPGGGAGQSVPNRDASSSSTPVFANSSSPTPANASSAAAASAIAKQQKKDQKASARPKIDYLKRKQRQYGIFEAINAVAERRNQAKATNGTSNITKKIESPVQGMPSQRTTATPAELSRMKAERDRQLAQVLLAQQSQAAAGFPFQQGGVARPIVRPSGGLPTNHPLAQQVRPMQSTSANTAAVAAAAAAAVAAAGRGGVATTGNTTTAAMTATAANTASTAINTSTSMGTNPTAAAVAAAKLAAVRPSAQAQQLAQQMAAIQAAQNAGMPVRMPTQLTAEQVQAILRQRQAMLAAAAAAQAQAQAQGRPAGGVSGAPLGTGFVGSGIPGQQQLSGVNHAALQQAVNLPQSQQQRQAVQMLQALQQQQAQQAQQAQSQQQQQAQQSQLSPRQQQSIPPQRSPIQQHTQQQSPRQQHATQASPQQQHLQAQPQQQQQQQGALPQGMLQISPALLAQLANQIPQISQVQLQRVYATALRNSAAAAAAVAAAAGGNPNPQAAAAVAAAAAAAQANAGVSSSPTLGMLSLGGGSVAGSPVARTQTLPQQRSSPQMPNQPPPQS